MNKTTDQIMMKINEIALLTDNDNVVKFFMDGDDALAAHENDEQFLKDFLAKMIKMDKFNC